MIKKKNNVFVWGAFCSSSTKDSLVRFIEVLSFHLICNVKTYHKWVTEDNLLSTFFSFYFALISSCKIKVYKHVFSQIQIVLLHVFVCAHTHAAQCVKIRGQITTPLSTMWVWVPNSGHWLSLAARSLPVSNLDDSQADTDFQWSDFYF